MDDKKHVLEGPTSELPEETRKTLDALDEQLETLDHYAILGLDRGATRAQVRSALLVAASPFHPDRYFGRRIDPVYAGKMQRVFARMALAHDVLLDDAKRAQYDAALPVRFPGTEGASPAPPRARLPSSDRVAASEPPRSQPQPRHLSSGTMRAPSTPEIERARAQAFASRLAGGTSRMRASTPAQAFPGAGRPPSAGPAAPRASSPPTSPADSKAAAEALRRRYEESKAQARTRHASEEVAMAEAAQARGDHLEAARLYRVAIEHVSDPVTKASLARAEHEAKEQGRAAAIERARAAEQKQDFTQAAIEWARAFDAMPTADSANRAAACFRRSGGDHRRAARYGEEAVKLEPTKAAYHVTLALVYADAGLVLRAKGEIERAAALDPEGSAVKEAAARIKALR
jgi:curved DNA-binding protein CbpA